MTTKIIEQTNISLSDMNDEHLVQEFVQGDPRAFDYLYDRYAKTVYKRVQYRIPGTDVEDVAQEVFLAVINSLPSFRGKAMFGTWLRKITDNKVSEYYRKRTRKKETMQVDLVHAEKKGDDSNSSSLEDNILLRHALNNLHKKYREVILLRFAEEMTFNEIANYLDKSLEASKSHFRRAMSALQEELDIKNE
jgi:RNA polymerase sigma-70 factor (ECF subfamily)